MHLTLGSDEEVTGLTVKEVARRVEEDLAEKYEGTIAEQTKKRIEAEEVVVEDRRKDEARRRRFKEIANTAGSWISKFLTVLMIAAVTIGAPSAIVFPAGAFNHGLLAGLLLALCWIVFAGLSIFALYKIIRGLSDWVGDRAEAFFYNKLTAFVFAEERVKLNNKLQT